MFKRFSVLLIVTMLSGIIASTVKADTIYSTFGPGDTYAATGRAIFHTAYIAVPFKPQDDYFLDSIELAAFAFQSAVNIMEVNLKNNANGLPGSLIHTFSFPSFPLGRPGAILSTNSTSSPLISNGVQYWLEFKPSPLPLTGFALPFNLSDIRGVASLLYTGEWVFYESRVSPSFRVNGSPVDGLPTPEPTTMLLLGTGLVGVAGAARRRKKNQA